MASSVYHFKYTVEDGEPWSSNRYVSPPGTKFETYIDLDKIITITPSRHQYGHVLTITICVVGQEKPIVLCEHEFFNLPVSSGGPLKCESSFASNVKRLIEAWVKVKEYRRG